MGQAAQLQQQPAWTWQVAQPPAQQPQLEGTGGEQQLPVGQAAQLQQQPAWTRQVGQQPVMQAIQQQPVGQGQVAQPVGQPQFQAQHLQPATQPPLYQSQFQPLDQAVIISQQCAQPMPTGMQVCRCVCTKVPADQWPEDFKACSPDEYVILDPSTLLSTRGKHVNIPGNDYWKHSSCGKESCPSHLVFHYDQCVPLAGWIRSGTGQARKSYCTFCKSYYEK